MITLIILPVILTATAISIVVRIVLRLLFNPYRLRNPYLGPYGYNGYGHGYRRHHLFGHGLFSIAILVALERLFNRRW